jgi:hypothetical protein
MARKTRSNNRSVHTVTAEVKVPMELADRIPPVVDAQALDVTGLRSHNYKVKLRKRGHMVKKRVKIRYRGKPYGTALSYFSRNNQLVHRSRKAAYRYIAAEHNRRRRNETKNNRRRRYDGHIHSVRSDRFGIIYSARNRSISNLNHAAVINNWLNRRYY